MQGDGISLRRIIGRCVLLCSLSLLGTLAGAPTMVASIAGSVEADEAFTTGGNRGAVRAIEADAPSSPISAAIVFHGARDLRQVALTFDACQDLGPLTGFDRPVVDVLNGTETPATLFLSGLWVAHHQEETAELAENPLFELGNHSWSHPDFTQIDRVTMIKEIADTQRLIGRYADSEPVLFRFPYGHYDDTALAVVAEQGLTAVQWDVEPGDPAPDVTVADILATVERQVSGGSIIVMHINGNGRQTAEALPYVIRSLRAKGYEFVTVSQLLEGQAGAEG